MTKATNTVLVMNDSIQVNVCFMLELNCDGNWK